MSPKPTGHLRRTPLGADLVIERTFRAPIEDVLESVTASESTARWIGPWSGEAGPGKTVQLQMTFEKGAPTCNMTIDACDPPHHLALSTKDDHGEWRLEVTPASKAEATLLTFVQHLSDASVSGEVGPGGGVLPRRARRSASGRVATQFRRVLSGPAGLLQRAAERLTAQNAAPRHV